MRGRARAGILRFDWRPLEREKNMLHWKNTLTLASAAALVVLAAFGGFGWTW
jgi:hypothetical protein